MAEHPKEGEINKLGLNEIDYILDEIEDREEKQDKINVNWEDILNQLRVKNINYIKTLITSKDIDINAQNPMDGKTLLIYAVIIGSLELVTAITNFGADPRIADNDGNDALVYANVYGRYNITRLIFFRTLSGSVGNDLKQISSEIKRQSEEAEYIWNADIGSSRGNLCEYIQELILKAMIERAPFDETMLFYAFYFTMKTAHEKGVSPFELQLGRYGDGGCLWETMMKTYESILSNTSDKKGWKFLRKHFINSYIWFLPHPIHKENTDETKVDNENEIDNEYDKMEKVLKNTLFHELLTRVRKESKKQSDELLKSKIDKLKKEKPKEWNELISYNVHTEYSKTARQDKCGSLKPKYDEEQLSEDKYPPSTHFSAKKHYDTNIYLNELLFTANILDDMFQKQMKKLTKEINNETGGQVKYRAGPVKTLTRSQAKVENDYINEQYPTSSKILDINRCALQCQSIQELMKYLKIFDDKIKAEKAGCIKKIIRCKNGWSVYNDDLPAYTDIKLNILIESAHDGAIVAEIQFLLALMSSFKKKAHKLYNVERKFEMVYNYGLLTQKMSKFKDNKTAHNVFKELALNDDVKYFKMLWENIERDSYSLIKGDKDELSNKIFNHSIMIIMTTPTHKISDYLLSNCKYLYQSSFLHFFNYQVEWKTPWKKSMGQLIQCYKGKLLAFLQNLFDLYDDEKLRKILFLTKLEPYDDPESSEDQPVICLFQAICRYCRDCESMKFLLKTERFNDKTKHKSLLDKSFCFGNDKEIILEIIKYVQNDQKILSKLLWNEHNKDAKINSNANMIIITLFTPVYDHLQTYFKDMYGEVVLFWMNYYGEKGYSVLQNIILNKFKSKYDKSYIIDQFTFLQRIFTLMNDKQLKQFVFDTRHGTNILFGLICINADTENIDSLKYTLFNPRINNKTKIKYLIEKRPRFKSNFNITLQALINQKNNQEILNKFAAVYSLVDLKATQLILEHDAFNYVTFTQPVCDNKLLGIKYLKDTKYKFIANTFKGGSLYVRIGKSGSYGSLGLGKDCKCKSIVKPTHLDAFNHVNVIAIASKNHTLVVDINGNVYGTGSNRSNELGLGEEEEEEEDEFQHKKKEKEDYIYIPQLLPVFCKCKAINVAVGLSHSLILTEDGNVWSCGSNEKGQLGHGNQNDMNRYVSSPKLVETLKDYYIIQISCGNYISCAVSQDGKLFTWGANCYGEGYCGLGKGNDDKDIVIPTQVNLNGLKALCVDCGENHTLLLTINGIVLSFGYGYYRLGHGNMDTYINEQWTPKIIESLLTKRVINISAGECYCLCVTQDGECYSWGKTEDYNNYGLLGHGENVMCQPKPRLIQYFVDNNIKIISCETGTKHSGVITSNGQLYIFGANEYNTETYEAKCEFIPVKIKYFNQKRVTAISLGDYTTLVIGTNEEKNDNKIDNDIIYLNGNKQKHIYCNKMENNLLNKSYKIYIQNEKLFNCKDWILMKENNRKYCQSSKYTTSVIDNLQICDDDDAQIELVNTDKINKIYYDEILKSKYVLLLNENRQYINIKEIISLDDIIIYSFDDIKNIKFVVPKSKNNHDGKLSLYVQPLNSNDFVLIKQLKIRK